MREVIYKGVKLQIPDCYRYYQVKHGDITTVRMNDVTSTYELTFRPGESAETIAKACGDLEVLDNSIPFEPMHKPTIVSKSEVIFTLNGRKFKKLTSDDHIVNIIIVADHESRVIQNYSRTTIIVSEDDYKNQEFIDLVFTSGQLIYITPIEPKKCFQGWNLRNFPKIIIGSESINLTSESETAYYLRKNYTQYVIRTIDYLDQFIKEVSRILDGYGLQLTRINREETLKNTSYISYSVNQTPYTMMHPRTGDDEDILSHKIAVDFEIRTPNLDLFHDFKNRYNNVRLLSTLTEIKVEDKYGERWTAAIKWGPIGEDFIHGYSTDNNSNFGFQSQFRCEIYYYEVFDRKMDFIREIVSIII